MITYNVDGVKMPKIKKRDTSALDSQGSCISWPQGRRDRLYVCR